jgi:hypothetical protein
VDRCKCWKITKVEIFIEHCPSAEKEIAKEMDRVTEFAMKGTSLNRFGKTRISALTTTDLPAVGEPNDLSSLPTETDLRLR